MKSFFLRRVHISDRTLAFLNGEFEVEPAQGERREEALRIAGLKTYFITKVLQPVCCIYKIIFKEVHQYFLDYSLVQHITLRTVHLKVKLLTRQMRKTKRKKNFQNQMQMMSVNNNLQ